MSYEQGDIVLVPFPFTVGTSSKPRPAIVVSNSIVNKTQDVILAQITSKPRKDFFTYVLETDKLSQSLNLVSQVRCHKIFIIEKSTIFKKISKLDDEGFAQLKIKIFSLF